MLYKFPPNNKHLFLSQPTFRLDTLFQTYILVTEKEDRRSTELIYKKKKLLLKIID